MDSPSCVAHTSLLPSSSCSRPFMVSHAGTFRDPMGPPQGPSRYFLGQPRTHRSDPLWRAEFLVSEIDDACPWAWYLHSCFSLGLWVGVALPPLPGPCSAPRPCLGGSGWGWAPGPRPTSAWRAPGSASPGSHPPGSTSQVSPRLPYKAGTGRSLVGLVLCRLWMLTGGCGRGRGDWTE